MYTSTIWSLASESKNRDDHVDALIKISLHLTHLGSTSLPLKTRIAQYPTEDSVCDKL